MAWLDDRFWAHPKVTGLSDRAYRVHVNGICYSSGMSTHGRLDDAQIKLLGGGKKERKELVFRRLWIEKGTEGVLINDWAEHNDKRDEKRAADRERKRLARAKEREERTELSDGQGADSPPDNPQDSSERVRRTEAGQNVGPARAEEVKGEGSEEEPKAVALDVDHEPDETNGPGQQDIEELQARTAAALRSV